MFIHMGAYKRKNHYFMSLIFFLFALIILPAKTSGYDGIDDYTEIPPSYIQYQIENPASDSSNMPKETDWSPYTHKNTSGKGFIWLRLSLSQLHDTDSVNAEVVHKDKRLFLYPSPAYYEVYQNNQLILKGGDLNSIDPRKNVPRWDMLQLEDPTEDIYVRFHGKMPYLYAIGTSPQLIAYLLKLDVINVISIISFFVIGLMALFLYSYHRKLRLLLFYSLFIIVHFSFWPLITFSLSRQLYFPIPAVTQFYLVVLGEIAAITLLLLLFREIIHPIYRKWVLRAVYLFSIAGISGLAATVFYANMAIFLFPLLSILIACNLVLILTVSILSIKKQRNSELVFFSLGLILFVFFEAIINLALVLDSKGLSDLIKLLRPLTIVLPGALIIINRYRKADAQVKEYAAGLQQLSAQLEEDNRLLEQRVLERTKELEETHEQLIHSIQDGAKASAEIAALEERNRIAQEIHDIVGHTLTTTIVQIEAGKRLIAKQPQQAVERMETSQMLIRKGLDEVRNSVRMLKEAEWKEDLPKALREIMRETAEYADVQIQSFISIDEPLSVNQKTFIYMALKEGITNGIKHGGCNTFIFNLKQEDDLIIFQLKNDGKPASKTDLGFGLTMMKKRAESLQGTLRIYFEEDWNYVLEVRFPVS